jgi:uncharacterized protein YutE (UPF0331/DUF86 family)
VIAPPLAQAVARLARFRNLLIHEYAIIKGGRMCEYLHNTLVDFDRFASAVRAYLRRR